MKREELLAIVTGQILGGMVVRLPQIQQVPTDHLVRQAADLAEKVVDETHRRAGGGQAAPPEPAPRPMPSLPIRGL